MPGHFNHKVYFMGHDQFEKSSGLFVGNQEKPSDGPENTLPLCVNWMIRETNCPPVVEDVRRATLENDGEGQRYEGEGYVLYVAPQFILLSRTPVPSVSHRSAVISPLLAFLKTAKLWSRFAMAAVLFSFIPSVRAENGDDFANNLFSDLAPILALFGEQVAKQFLSESSGRADDILFAMAPLGVITAIVSAIRVTGHPWLKTIVGRGKEGDAQTELELMSSNSPDVGEMWNGQAIVRVLGTPSIFELVYAPDKLVSDPAAAISILSDESPFFERTQGGHRLRTRTPIAHNLWNEDFDIEMREPLLTSGYNSHSSQENAEKTPPNISLNARGKLVSNFEKWLMAIIGIVIQLMVLIFGGLISYHPTWKWHFPKNDAMASPQAYPCTAVGTISLSLGMLICSYVIDCASTEENWILKGSQPCKVAWVQRGGTVNDQVFSPYLIFGHKGQKHIITSRRCNQKILMRLRFWVFLGTVVSVAGFITQFIGLRGMHWSASIAQLAATAFMTIIRSLVRRRMTREPEASEAVESHELDCMARKMGDCVGWKVVPEIRKDLLPANDNGVANSVMLIRKRLGDLSGWSTELQDVVHALCIAMEKTMKTIYLSNEIHLREHAKQLVELPWTLPVLTLSETEPPARSYGKLSFNLTRSDQWGTWKMSEDAKREMVAVLSLWKLSYGEEESFYRTRNILPEAGDLRAIRTMAKVLAWPSHEIDREVFKLWMGGQDLDIYQEDPKELSSQKNIPIHRFIGKLETRGDLEDNPRIVLFSNTPVEKLFAQQIFSEFFSAIVPFINNISGSMEIKREGSDILELRNSSLSKLVEMVSETGLGTRWEIMTNIVPHLWKHDLLPSIEDESEPVLIYSRIEHNLRRSRVMNQWDITASHILRLTEHHHGRQSSETGERLGAWSTEKIRRRFCKRITAFESPKENDRPDHPRRLFLQWLGTYDVGDPGAFLRGSWITYFRGVGSLDHPGVRKLLAPFGRMGRPSSKELVLLRNTMDVDSRKGQAEILQEAARDGYDSVVEALIDRNMNTWEADDTRASPLLVASSRGNASVVQLILHQLLLRSPNHYRQFQARDLPILLWSAAKSGHRSTVRLLREHVAVVSRVDYGDTALIIAAGKGHVDIVKELLRDGASPNAGGVGNFNQTWLLIGHNEAQELLRIEWDASTGISWESGAKKGAGKVPQMGGQEGYWGLIAHFLENKNTHTLAAAIRVRTAIQAAAEGGYLDVVNLLLKHGAHVNTEISGLSRRTALQAAAGGGHLAVVDRLLREGADVNATVSRWFGRTALQAAAEGGYLTVVNRLLEMGADVNAKPAPAWGKTALQAAAEGGHLPVVNRLLESGARVNSDSVLRDAGRTALQAAAGGGHLVLVDRLLAEGANINAEPASAWGRTALQTAAEGGHLTVVDRLLERGAKINAEPAFAWGRTALQAAAGGGFLKVVDRLVEMGADVNARPSPSLGRTALQAAADAGHIAVVDRLLENGPGADVNAEPALLEGRTALQAAAEGGHLEVVDRLLGKGADTNAEPARDRGRTALQAAAGGGHIAVVDRLLENGADVNAAGAEKEGRTALQAAAQGGHLAVVNRLLGRGADVNGDPGKEGGRTALQAAAQGGHLAVVDLLLGKEARVNVKAVPDRGRTALQAAAEGGYVAVVDRLLETGADVNAEAATTHGRTALQAAAEEGHLGVVYRLLEKGADVNAEPVSSFGRTALQAAAGGGHVAVVDRLVEKGADINARPAWNRGQTALQAAANGGHLAVVDRLLESADVNANPGVEEGRTALQAAAQGGHLAVVDRLLEMGADINAEAATANGRTALQAAAGGGYLALVDRLLEKGADVNGDPAASLGRTALQAAAEGGHLEVVDRLLDNGANINAQPALLEGRTALQAAKGGGHLAVVDRLLENGADANVVSKENTFLWGLSRSALIV